MIHCTTPTAAPMLQIRKPNPKNTCSRSAAAAAAAQSFHPPALLPADCAQHVGQLRDVSNSKPRLQASSIVRRRTQPHRTAATTAAAAAATTACAHGGWLALLLLG
jgi:hypothetical protein